MSAESSRPAARGNRYRFLECWRAKDSEHAPTTCQFGRTLKRCEFKARSERQRAEGKEVTEGNLGFPSFVYRRRTVVSPGRVTEGNLGFPLFVHRRRNSP